MLGIRLYLSDLIKHPIADLSPSEPRRRSRFLGYANTYLYVDDEERKNLLRASSMSFSVHPGRCGPASKFETIVKGFPRTSPRIFMIWDSSIFTPGRRSTFDDHLMPLVTNDAFRQTARSRF